MKRTLGILCVLLVPLMFLGNFTTAEAAGPAPIEQTLDGPVQVRLVSEKEAISPGEPFWVALEFNMEEGWHTYWKNPGDAGFAPEIAWQLPSGFEVTELQWPYPERLEEDALVSFGYKETMVLLAKIIAPKKLTDPQHIDIVANVRWVACKDSCMPGKAEHRLTLPVRSEPAPVNPQVKKLFDEARRRVPSSATAIEMAHEGGELILKVGEQELSGDFAEGYFFPEKEGAFDYAALPKLTRSGGHWALSLPFSGKLADAAASLKGVLVFKDHNQKTVALEIGGASPIAKGSHASAQLLIALLCALGGGLILNLMPCVLPVISLKVMSFMNLAGSCRKTLFKHGGAFTLGVLMSFWVLAGLLLVLRASGQSMGWGFQLQEPIFVGALVMILFLLGLSLLGVFELGTSLSKLGAAGHKQKGLTSSFLSGVLATVVATPCTGPLLAPALGFAMALPAAGSIAIFTAMGLGMASPYLLISAFPKLMNKIPKPGPWMVIFKQVMGFFMLATVLWLIWVFQAQMSSPFGLMAMLAALLVLGIGAWVYGKWGTQMVRKSKRYIAYGATAALLLTGFTMGLLPVKADPGAGHSLHAHELEGDWIPFDAAKLAQLQKEGVPVFVDFTAKWCLTCQTNKMATHSAEAKKHFDQKGVVRMVADWTNSDPAITKELAKFNRNSVPLYVIYKGEEEPIILPQLLSTGTVIEHLSQLDK
ncbi:MAG: protein-disulfide reductase DsbD family protein [Parachlamydiales bacterium]